MSWLDPDLEKYLDHTEPYSPGEDEATPIFLSLLSGDTRVYYGDYKTDLEPLLKFTFGDKDLRRGYGTDDPAGKDPQELAVDIAISRGLISDGAGQVEQGDIDVVESIRWLFETYRHECARARLYAAACALCEREGIDADDVGAVYKALEKRHPLPKKPRTKPARKYKRAGRPAPATAITAIDQLPAGSDRRSAYMLMLRGGLRIAEALDLKWADLQVEPGYLYVRHGKGGKDRLVPLAPDLERELAALLKERKLTGRVCAGDKVIRTSRAALQKWAERRGFGVHELRHRAITDLYRAGLDIQECAKFAGHSSTKTTERYRHVTAEDLRRSLGWES